MPEVQITESENAGPQYLEKSGPGSESVSYQLGRLPQPTAKELAVLSPFERLAFQLCTRMNQGRWKRFWTWCQIIFGAGWIQLSTYNLMNVYGLEHVEAVSHD